MKLKALICRGAALAGLAGVLAGCTMPWQKPAPTSCPQLSILADAATVTRHKPGVGRDVLDVVYTGAYASAEMECDYDIDSVTRAGTLTVELQLAFEVARGPAGTGPNAELTYFVALIDGDGQVMNKKVFTVVAEYDDNANRAIVTDQPVLMDIPLKPRQSGENFEIFSGFQLTRDELSKKQRN